MPDVGPLLESVLARCDLGGDDFELREAGGGRYRLELWGTLPRAWAGNLALHCFASGLGIVEADAVRVEASRWAACFLLESTAACPARPGGDFLLMARRAPRLVPKLPEPEVHVAVALSREEPGCVFAHVTGPDSIGLLAELLRRFEAFGLCPRQLALRTEAGRIRDWFWLEPAPAGSRVPTSDAREVRLPRHGSPAG